MSQIKRGAIISYAAIFLNIVAGLLYTPWMVRQIGVSDYGLYALIGAFLSYFMLDFGLGQAIARFIANARAKGDETEVEKLISTTTKIYLIIDLFIAVSLLITFFLLSMIFGDFTPEELGKFKIVFCIAGFFSIMNFPFMPQNGIMIAYERFIVLKATGMIQKLGVVALMITAIYLGYGLFALVLINGLVGFALSLYKYWYIRRTTCVKINLKHFDKSLAKQLFKFSVWIFIIGIAQRLLLNIAPTIIGVIAGTAQIAVFAIGMSLEAYTWTFASALNGLFMPKVARLSLSNQTRKQINELMIRVGRIQLLIVGFIITGIVVLGKAFILLWMGGKFENSYVVALCLIVPGIVTLTQEIANSLLFVENEVRYRAILFISASVVSVIISCLLIPVFGAMGAAFGVVFALIICHIIGMNIVYQKVLKLDIISFFRECHLKMLLPMIFAAILSLLIQYYLPIDSWLLFVAQGIVFAVVFYVLMWFISMNEYEKTLVKSVVLPIITKIR